MSLWRRWWQGKFARRLLAPWRMRPEIWRLEAQLADMQAAVVRLEQARDSQTAIAQLEQTLTRETAELRRQVADARAPAPPFGCPMPDGTLLVHTLYGNRYFIDPLDMVLGPEIIVTRQWEAEISALMVSAADPNLVFVDVGANFGYFSCLMGSRIGRGGAGRVYAIEPNPACVGLLRRNAEINWSMCPVEICDCAVGDRNGSLKLFVPINHSANGYLGDAHNKNWEGFPSVDVALRPLDELIPAEVTVDLMKIDVEGHEYAVLAGAARVIARSPRLHIVMEWSPGQIERAGYTTAQVLGLTRELGLQACRLAPDFSRERLRERALSDEALLALGYDNIVLVRRDWLA